MKPGKELDALIAEKVFGAKIVTSGFSGTAVHVDFPDRKPGTFFNQLPEYSTDMAAAWEVIEKHDGQWKIEGQEHIGWTVNFVEASMREDRYEKPFQATAETSAHAICLAALKAVGALEE